jgi:hypothetical protein
LGDIGPAAGRLDEDISRALGAVGARRPGNDRAAIYGNGVANVATNRVAASIRGCQPGGLQVNSIPTRDSHWNIDGSYGDRRGLP